MFNRIVIGLFFLAIFGAILLKNDFREVEAASSRPNIVLIVADDLGYADISPYNPDITHTPNLERLAATGVQLTDFYTSAAVCTPTRAALLTGRHQIRTNMVNVNYSEKQGLMPWESTLGEELQEEGYATAIVGKWHLGMGEKMQFSPTHQGFDYFYGVPFSNNYRDLAIYQNEEIITTSPNQETLTQQLTEHAMTFIAEKADEEPFFLYLPYTAPHFPLFVRDEFAHPETQTLYEDVVGELDWGVGEILNQLERHNIRQNTLVIFISDNGPELNGNYAESLHMLWGEVDEYGRSRWERERTGTLHGSKGTLFEGGVRVPFIASWPEGFGEGGMAGQVLHTPAVITDILPTLVSLAGGEPNHAPLDGQDILPILRGQGQQLDEPRAFYFGSNNDWIVRAVRSGHWKLHWDASFSPTALYDLSSAGGLLEQENVLSDNPEIAKQLIEQAQRYQEDLEKRPLLQSLDAKLAANGLSTDLVLLFGGAIFLVAVPSIFIYSYSHTRR